MEQRERGTLERLAGGCADDDTLERAIRGLDWSLGTNLERRDKEK